MSSFGCTVRVCHLDPIHDKLFVAPLRMNKSQITVSLPTRGKKPQNRRRKNILQVTGKDIKLNPRQPQLVDTVRMSVPRLPLRNMRKGDYDQSSGRTFEVASAYATDKHSMAPRIVANRNSSRIVHKELIGSVIGSSAFTVPLEFALNPGISATFPWLSSQAQGWEQYRFNKIKFCYLTRTGSQVPGSCMMVPDYDSADSAPLTEQIASTYEDTVESAPWRDFCTILSEKAMFPNGPKKFIRSGSLAANLDIKTYDAGNLFICTVDGTAVNWGKIWVEYDVTLFTPQTNPNGFILTHAQRYVGTAPDSSDLLGSTSTSTGDNLTSVTGNIITFLQAGYYFVNYNNASTSSTFTSATGAAGLSASSVNYSGTGTGDFSYNTEISTPIGGTLTFVQTIVTGTASNLMIAQIPSIL